MVDAHCSHLQQQNKCAPSGGALHSADCESIGSHRSGRKRLIASALLERRHGDSMLQRRQRNGGAQSGSEPAYHQPCQGDEWRQSVRQQRQ
jgi:hypothetical protein